MSLPNVGGDYVVYDLLSCTVSPFCSTHVSHSSPPSTYKMNLICAVGDTFYIALGQDIHIALHSSMYSTSSGTSASVLVKTASVINSMQVYPVKNGTSNSNVMVITCHDDGSVQIHHNTTLVFHRHFDASAWGQCLCPISNTLFVSANDHIIYVIDLNSNFVGSLKGHKHNIPCVDYKNGYLVSGGIDKLVRVWTMVEEACLDDRSIDDISKETSTWCCVGQLKHLNWVWAVQWIHKQDIRRGHDAGTNHGIRSPAEVIVEGSSDSATSIGDSDGNPLELPTNERFASEVLLLEQAMAVDETHSVDGIHESDFDELDRVLQWDEHEELQEAWQVDEEHEGDHGDTQSQVSTNRFNSEAEEQVTTGRDQPVQITTPPETFVQPTGVPEMEDFMPHSQQISLHFYYLAVATDRDFYIYNLPDTLPILSCRSILSSISTSDRYLLMRNYSLDWSFDRLFGMQWISELSTMVLANQMGFIVLVHIFWESEGSSECILKSREVLLPKANQITTPLLGFTVRPIGMDFSNKLDKCVRRRSFEVSVWHVNGVVNAYELSEQVINDDII